MNIGVTNFIRNQEARADFSEGVATIISPYLQFGHSSSTGSSLSPYYPLGNESIACELNVREETLLSRSAHHTIDVHL